MSEKDSSKTENDFDTIDLLQLAREEGQRTIDKQIETVDDFNDKAARILRLNLLVLSILLTGFSILASEDSAVNSVSAAELENGYIFIGIGMILVSTILAALTYMGSNYRSGMSGRDISDKILNPEIAPEDALYDTAKGYARWAQHNFKVNTRLAPMSTAMLLSLVYGLVFLTAGVTNAYLWEFGYGVLIAIIVTLLIITWRSGLFKQIRRYSRYRGLDPEKH